MKHPLRITDHALIRFLERAGGLDVEAVRAELSESLSRARGIAAELGMRNYTIKADGLIYAVRNDTVTTVLIDRKF